MKKKDIYKMMEEVTQPIHVQYHRGYSQSEQIGHAFTVSDTTPIVQFVRAGSVQGDTDEDKSFCQRKIYSLRKRFNIWRLRKLQRSNYLRSPKSDWVRFTFWMGLILALFGLTGLIGYLAGPQPPRQQVHPVFIRLNNGSTLLHYIMFWKYTATIAVPKQGNIENLKNTIDFAKGTSVYSLPDLKLCIVRTLITASLLNYQTFTSAVERASNQVDVLTEYPAEVPGWRSRPMKSSEFNHVTSNDVSNIKWCLGDDVTIWSIENIVKENETFSVTQDTEVASRSCLKVYLPSFGVVNHQDSVTQQKPFVPRLSVSGIDVVKLGKCTDYDSNTFSTITFTTKKQSRTVSIRTTSSSATSTSTSPTS